MKDLLFFNLNYLSCYSFSLFSFQRTLVGSSGFEPPTSCLSGMRSNHLSYEPICDSPGLFSPSFPVSIHSRGCGGDDGIRTHDPLLAGQVLSQLSYTPILSPAFSSLLVGSSGLEPPTSRLSGARSNQLSYEPLSLRLVPLLSWWR